MNHIDFHNIEVLCDSKQSSFEDLCLHLFCRDLKVSVIDSYRNQPGIETDPVIVKTKKIGFQVKYFQGKFDWDQIKHSLLGSEHKKTKSKKLDIKFPDNVFKKYSLNKIYIYSNKEKTLAGREKTKAEKLIDKFLDEYKCQIVYVCDKALQLTLSKPSNKDLAQLYFGVSDELGLIKKTIPIKTLTFLNSTECLNLPLIDDLGKKVYKLNNYILSNKKDIHVILGSPGSGKSILIRKLFQQLGGLDQPSEEKRIKLLTKNKLVPLLINLKDCAFDSIDNLVRTIKSDFNLTKSNFGFFYLFDGLDELSEEKVDAVLSYVHQLSSTEDSCKILISCRKGNANKRRLSSFFSFINEIVIDDLSQTDIHSYFIGKNNKDKQELLSKIKQSNNDLLHEIKDILLVDLLWQTIEDINENSTVIDLLEKKVDLLLDAPSHINSLNDLNLLNPKKEKVVTLLQSISFKYHDKRKNKFQFRFCLSELQYLTLELLPRSDYRSTNKIINYISDLFFDTSETSGELSETYIFRHRRYQEYFFAQKLKTEYEQDPKILRKLNVISGKDFFEDLFLPYLRNEYTASNNLQGIVDINLIDVYLGNHSGFGIDDNDYMLSSEFLTSLLSQNNLVFYELLNDPDINMEKRFFIDIGDVEDLIEKIQTHNDEKSFYKVEDEFKSLWEDRLSKLVNYSVIFWKSGREDFSLRIQRNLSDVMEKIKSSNVLDLIKSELEHPYWKSFDDYLYLQIIINSESAIDILNNLIRNNYSNIEEHDYYPYRQSAKDRLISSFLRLVIQTNKVQIIDIFKELDSWEKIRFISILFNDATIPLILSDHKLLKIIKEYVRTVPLDKSEYYLYILAFKKLFGIRINKADLERTNAEWEKLRGERPMDWGFREHEKRFALSSFVLEKFCFAKFLKPQTGHAFRYYNDQGLYAALYNGLINISAGLEKTEDVVGDFVKYVNFYYEGRDSNNYLSNEISKVLAVVFSKSDNIESLKPFIRIINTYEQTHFNLYIFYLELHKLSPLKFNKLVVNDDLLFMYEMLNDWQEEFRGYVDICFSLSRMLSGINTYDARRYFYKGINDGVLRHGWRKDTLVSYGLVGALDTIWSIGACSREKLLEYTKKIFKLTRRVVDITDGKGTVNGPYNVLRLISRYDPELTADLYQQLDQYSWQSNMSLNEVISSKVKFGYDLDIIFDELTKFNKYYNYRDGVDPEYYDQQIIALLKITESYLYTDEEKRRTFDKICILISDSSNDVDRILKDKSYNKYKDLYNKNCEKYGVEKYFNVIENISEDQEEENNEYEFVKEIGKVETTNGIERLYKELNDYQKEITLSKRESWELLLDKTYAVCGNIQLFIDLLGRHYYPHSDWFSRHSKYLHLAMSVALENINTNEEVFTYLKDSTGHGGFSNLIKAYSINNDKDMCMKLFKRYLQLCEFLVT